MDVKIPPLKLTILLDSEIQNLSTKIGRTRPVPLPGGASI